jgi:hypothetical protein
MPAAEEPFIRDTTATVLPLPLAEGILVALLLSFTRYRSHLDSRISIQQSEATSPVGGFVRDVRLAQQMLIAMIVVLPLFVGLPASKLVDLAFTSAQLRKEQATIHVKTPWDSRISQSTLRAESSFLGSDYKKFDGVRVLLRSVGNKVIIELPQDAGKPSVKLPIPTDSVYVE